MQYFLLHIIVDTNLFGECLFVILKSIVEHIGGSDLIIDKVEIVGSFEHLVALDGPIP